MSRGVSGIPSDEDAGTKADDVAAKTAKEVFELKKKLSRGRNRCGSIFPGNPDQWGRTSVLAGPAGGRMVPELKEVEKKAKDPKLLEAMAKEAHEVHLLNLKKLKPRGFTGGFCNDTDHVGKDGAEPAL